MTDSSSHHRMQRLERLRAQTALFVFDIEFIGDVREIDTCFIWEIAVTCVTSGQMWQAVVDPDPNVQVFPEPPIPEIPRLTRAFLTQHDAKPWSHVFGGLSEWIQQQSNGQIPVLISHNTFRADKPILEYECQRYGMRVPGGWYFFDSLHFARQSVKCSTGNYSLSGLHRQLFQAPIDNVHRAAADVHACMRILAFLTGNTWSLTGPMYPAYATSLRSLRWVGRKAEQVFEELSIHSVEALMMYIQHAVRARYILTRQDEWTTIIAVVHELLQNKLPSENVQNIANVIRELFLTRPFSQTFVLKNHLAPLQQ